MRTLGKKYVDFGGIDSTGVRDLLDVRDRRGAHVEAGVGAALVDRRTGVGVVLRVAEAVQVGDVVLGHAEGARQDQRLEHRGVELPVGLRLAGQGGVHDRRVRQGQRWGTPPAPSR